MAYVSLPEGVPGILGPLVQYPEIGKALGVFTEALMRGPSPLTTAERELIAAYVSRLNDCRFCVQSHAAASRRLFAESERPLVDLVMEDLERAPVGEKLKALLAIAAKVQLGGLHVRPADVERARQAGADDGSIHDSVLIAAAFCMFNRYVDGLATWTPEDPMVYNEIGQVLAGRGYLQDSAANPESA